TEGVVLLVSRVRSPLHSQAPLVDHQAQLDAYDPAAVGQAFAPDLLWASAFPDGVDQFDAIAVCYSQHRRVSQETCCPLLVSGKQSEQAGALRQLREQWQVIALDPVVESPTRYSLDGKEQSEGDHL